MDGANGWTADEVFNTMKQSALTYDDLILMPGHIDFGVEQVDLSTRVTRNLEVKTPIVSSPMDTVTEADMATAMSLWGGLGIIHGNQDVNRQVGQIMDVKRYENGFIMDPVCMAPHHTVRDLDLMKAKKGYSSAPITSTGELGGKLLGIVTSRDVDLMEGPAMVRGQFGAGVCESESCQPRNAHVFRHLPPGPTIDLGEIDRNVRLADVMTPAAELVTGTEPISLQKANEKLQEAKVGKLPIVNKEGDLVALITRTDLKTNREYPLASKDANKQLLVAAAIPLQSHGENDEGLRRASACVQAGADVLCLDSDQGDSQGQVDFLKKAKKLFPGIDIIAGNVVSCRQAKALLDAGADALKVGMGAGSLAITGDVAAIGRPQATAVYAVAKYARENYGIPILADGGVANSGQMMKALCMGASAVVCGSMLAGTEEAPGEYFYHNGLRVKAFRGLRSGPGQSGSVSPSSKGTRAGHGHRRSSLNNMTTSSVRTGVAGAVIDKGSVSNLIPYILQGVRHGMQDLGYKNLPAVHRALYGGDIRLECRSAAAQKEGAVHDLKSVPSAQDGSKSRVVSMNNKWM
eukprot:g3209.t1